MADPQQLQQQVEDLNNQLEAINDKVKDIGTNLTEGMINKLSTSISQVKKLGENLSKSKDLSKSIKDIQSALNKAIEKNEKISLARTIAEKKLNKAIQDGDPVLEKKYRKSFSILSTQLKLNQEIEDEIRKLLVATEERKKQSSLTGAISRALEKNLGVTKEQVKEMFTLTGLFTLLIDSAFKADRQATDLAKSLGLSKPAAMGIRQEFVEYSRAAGDTFVNTDRLLKAQQGLTEQLGLAVKFSGEEAEQFARLTEIVGLTNDEAGKLAQFSAATGASTEEYVADLRKGAFAAMQTNKIHISDKELLSSISKLSAGILVKFQNNPKALAEAVIQAKKLGLSLEQVDKIGESMLNFESSIEAELEAELITGKQLNFERARAAALTGDQATLMQEVAAQAGSLAEFQDMNVIAQQSLAKAFGMSRDEMAEMLMKQEVVNKYGDKAAELNAEQVKDMEKRNMTVDQYLKMQQEQRSAQDKFNDAMLKMQDIVGNLVAGPLGSFLGIISSILGHTEALAAILGGVMVFNIMKMLTVLKQAKKLSYGDAVVSIIKSAYQSLGGLPGIGMILAGSAAAAGIAYLATSSQKVEDGIAPPGQGPFTIKNKFGATAITATGDGLAVSPNINKASEGVGMAGIMTAINNLATNMSKPSPTPQFSLNVNGERLGSVVGRQQETGTQQTKNAYRLA